MYANNIQNTSIVSYTELQNHISLLDQPKRYISMTLCYLVRWKETAFRFNKEPNIKTLSPTKKKSWKHKPHWLGYDNMILTTKKVISPNHNFRLCIINYDFVYQLDEIIHGCDSVICESFFFHSIVYMCADRIGTRRKGDFQLFIDFSIFSKLCQYT